MIHPSYLTPALTRTLLVLVLWLIAIHSICFGISLIVLPCRVIEFFGFSLSEKFFAVQGGVFHLIISYAYITAALNPKGSKQMIILSCITKFSATLFLFGYYLFVKQIPMVLVSGVLDCLMGVVILILYLMFINGIHKIKSESGLPNSHNTI
ncbi:MAG: hypothetical protein M0Q38_10665 [Bacteroidales bacterium]|jgi:hypothetical protein|nr:hypothetical protein [Bacteroidales bacterium]